MHFIGVPRDLKTKAFWSHIRLAIPRQFYLDTLAVYPKYLDTLALYNICPKFEKKSLFYYLLMCLKTAG